MKKSLSVLLALALCLLAPHQASGLSLFSAAQTGLADSDAIPTGKATSIRVHIWDTLATGTSVVKIQVKVLSSDTNWYTVATITNADATGEVWLGEGADFTRVSITSCAGCSITGTLTAYLGDKAVIQ